MDLQDYLDGFDRRDWQERTEGTVRFAMLGLGWWVTDRAVPAVENSDRCETTVFVSSSTEKAEREAEKAGVEHGITYDEFHEGVAADAYDAVYICTPNALHLEYVETAADLGKDVLCEKPMEASVERAEKLVEAARAGDVTLMVAYRMHTEPLVRRARELYEAGVVGDAVQVHSTMTQPLLEIFEDPNQWRLNPDLAGPGTSVTDIGIYSINTTRYVLGEDPVSVRGDLYSAAPEFDDVPDERASFHLTFPDGAHAACSASQNAQQTGFFKLTGTEGALSIEPVYFEKDHRTLTVRRGDNAAEFSTSNVDQMEEEFDYFADRVLRGAPVEPDGEHGLVDVRVIEAVYEAAERDGPVSL